LKKGANDHDEHIGKSNDGGADSGGVLFGVERKGYQHAAGKEAKEKECYAQG